MDKHCIGSHQYPNKSFKLFNEKENDHKHLNKKTDLESTFQNIKLPSYEAITKERLFQSVSFNHSASFSGRNILSHRQSIIPSKKKSLTEEYFERYGDNLV